MNLNRLDEIIKIQENKQDSDEERCKQCYTLLSKKIDYDNGIVISKCVEQMCKLFNIEKFSILK